MDRSPSTSEDIRGCLILDGDNELLAKRIIAIQKKKVDTQRQEQKKQYIGALISLAQSEFGISKEEIYSMTIPEFNALKERIHTIVPEILLKDKIVMYVRSFAFFSVIGSIIFTIVMPSWISVLFVFIVGIVFTILNNCLPDDADNCYYVIEDNKKFAEEILPSDIY